MTSQVWVLAAAFGVVVVGALVTAVRRATGAGRAGCGEGGDSGGGWSVFFDLGSDGTGDCGGDGGGGDGGGGGGGGD
jgi:hypothetical protein